MTKKENIEFHKKKLVEKFPDSECMIKGNVLTWKGKLTPGFYCRSYEVEIVYEPFNQPESKVSLIGLEIPRIKSDIHMYENNNLCLFDTNNREWKPDMSIADTIVPWICEWLFFYEIWLVTHKWHGNNLENN